MKLSPSINAKLVSMGKSLQAEMETLLGPDGVLLYPPHPTVAPRHHYPICMPFNFAYTGEQLCTGLSVPSDRPGGGGVGASAIRACGGGHLFPCPDGCSVLWQLLHALGRGLELPVCFCCIWSSSISALCCNAVWLWGDVGMAPTVGIPHP